MLTATATLKWFESRRHGPCDDLASWRVSVDGLECDLSESFGYVGPTPPYLLGGIDLDGDGGQEIWAHTGWDAKSAHLRCSASAPVCSTM